jgi:hypothetical protein
MATRPTSSSGRAPHLDAGERRAHARIAANLPFATQLDGRHVRIEMDNLSEGGAYCRSEARFPVMTRMDVSLELPAATERRERADGARGNDDGLVRLQAVVVRCDPHPEASGSWSLALFFPAPEPDVREKLARYVRGRREAGGGGGEAAKPSAY